MPAQTPVNNFMVPATGTPNSVPVSGPFSATPLVVDFRENGLDGSPFVPQGLFADNTTGSAPLVIAIQGMNWSVVVPTGAQLGCQYPAPIGQIVSITGNNAGGSIIFCDFPVLPFSVSPAGGGGGPVTIADGADVTMGARADAPAANDTGAFSLMSFVKRMSAALTAMFSTGLTAPTTQGNSPDSAADVGNPVKSGAVYLANPPTYADGQRANQQADTRGNLKVTLIATNTNQLISTANGVLVQGTVAAGAAVVGNPVPQGLVAYTAAPTTRTNGTVIHATSTAYGVQVAKPFSIPELDWNFASAVGGIVNTTAAPIKTAAGAGLRNYLTGITYQNTSAVASEIAILDGVTVIWRGVAPAAMVNPSSIQFASPLKSTANAALNVQMATTATATYVNAQGYTAP